MTWRWLALAAAVAIALGTGGSVGAGGVREGGTFRVAFLVGLLQLRSTLRSSTLPSEGQLLSPTCGTLLAYPDESPHSAGFRLAPSLAEG